MGGRVGIFSDLHLHKWSEFATVNDKGINTRLLDQLRFLEWLARYAKDEKLETLVFIGDLFHKRGQIDVQVFNLAYEAIGKLCEVAEVHMVAGNHDQASMAGDVTAVSTFKWLGAKVYETPADVKLKSGHRVSFIPYHEAVEANRKAFKKAKGDVLFFHGGVKGATSGVIEYKPKEELEAEELPDRQVFCGHYHKHQSLRDGDIVFVGSPMQMNRGEAKDGLKGIVILEPSGKWQLMPWHSPRFMTVKAEELMPHAVRFENNFLDVLYDPNKQSPGDLLRLTKGAAGVKFVPAVPKLEGARRRVDVDLSLDNETLVRRYVEQFGQEGYKRPEKLVQIGLGLLKEEVA